MHSNAHAYHSLLTVRFLVDLCGKWKAQLLRRCTGKNRHATLIMAAEAVLVAPE